MLKMPNGSQLINISANANATRPIFRCNLRIEVAMNKVMIVVIIVVRLHDRLDEKASHLWTGFFNFGRD